MAERKIVLYNTHLNGLINYGEDQFNKIERVIQYFARRKNIILWWRPHPLTESTLLAMSPELLERYRKLVWEFHHMDNGILDLSTDINRAIAIADAYYGDVSSSVTMLFAATGKPMLGQDVKCNEELQDIPLGFSSFIENGSNIYFMSSFFNGFFSSDIQNGNTKLLGNLPEYPLYGKNPLMASYRNKQVLFEPSKCFELGVFNLKDRTYQKIPVPQDTQDLSYYDAVNYGQYVFLISKHKPVLRFDWNMYTVKSYDKCFEDLLKHKNCNYPLVFISEAVVKDSSIWIASSIANVVLELHMDTGDYQIHTIGEKGKSYSNIAYDGNCFWLTTLDGFIFRWDGNSSLEEIIEMPEGFERSGPVAFYKLIYCHTSLFVFPRDSNMLLKVDCINRTVICIRRLVEQNIAPGYCSSYSNYQCAGFLKSGDILAYSYFEGCAQLINGRTGSVKNIILQLSPEEKQYLLNQDWYCNGDCKQFNMEDHLRTLSGFLDGIAAGTLKSSFGKENTYPIDCCNLDGTCGYEIFKQVKSELNDR